MPLPLNSNYSISIVYQHPLWIITRENSTAPITVYLGTLGSLNYTPGGVGPTYTLDDTNPEVICLRSLANYYYTGTPLIPRYAEYGGLRVIASSQSHPSYNGLFHYSYNDAPYITIYNNNVNNHPRQMGTVRHELGHFTHYMMGGYYNTSKFASIHSLIKESFASYIGFREVNYYYSEKGAGVQNGQDISGQARQNWWKTDGPTAYYSPLFVDLVDDYNQRTGIPSPNAPNDEVRNFPIEKIVEIAETCTTWAQVKAKIKSYSSNNYTTTQLNNFLADWDYWFANN
jgi:hypothetical protein